MDGTGLLRTLFLSLALTGLPAILSAQTLPDQGAIPAPGVEYELGGAAIFAATLPRGGQLHRSDPEADDFRFPDIAPDTLLNGGTSYTPLGEVSIFGGERSEDGRDVVRFGTALTRGRTTTGVSISYGEDEAATRSELFVDYALTESFSFAVSGIVSEEGGNAPEAVTRLGLSAAFATGKGNFVQGGIANAPDRSPVFGVSVGLRF